MTIVVTGAAGFLGRHVVCELQNRGTPALSLTRRRPAEDAGTGDNVAVDLTDNSALVQLFSRIKPDTVLHCAGYVPHDTTKDSEERSHLGNVEATVSLLAAASKTGVRRIVFASTISVYAVSASDSGNGFVEHDTLAPRGFYGCQKLVCEEACQAWATGTGATGVILRLAGLHGGGRSSGVVYRFAAASLRGEGLVVSEPTTSVTLLNVQDAARAMVDAAFMRTKASVGVFNIAGGEEIDLESLARRIRTFSSSSSSIICGNGAGRRTALCIERARSAFGYDPEPLDSWLAREIASISNDILATK